MTPDPTQHPKHFDAMTADERNAWALEHVLGWTRTKRLRDQMARHSHPRDQRDHRTGAHGATSTHHDAGRRRDDTIRSVVQAIR